MPGMEVYGAEEQKEVLDVLQTGALFRYGHEHLRRGMWKVREFEEEVCRYTGAAHAHAVSSGSTAVAAMMAAAGIGHGDEVVVPPFTFVAPVEGVILAGALPVFAEIDETLCLSARSITEALTPRTRAVLLVHMCGAAAELDSIVELCRQRNLILLEDCGQAMGAFYKGRSVGRFGVAGSFSFDYFKIATCGEGGVTITDDPEIYRLMDQVSDHGHTHIGSNRGMEDHHVIGFNYRMGEINAGIGLAQMRKLPTVREQNRSNKAFMKSRLAEVGALSFRCLPDEEGDSATFLNFFLPDKATTEQAVDQLAADGVGGVTYWYRNMYHYINQWDHIKHMKFPARLAIHQLGAPQDYVSLQLPRSEHIMSRMLSIGIQCKWTEGQMEAYVGSIIQSLRKVL